jgi:hypothetical protein
VHKPPNNTPATGTGSAAALARLNQGYADVRELVSSGFVRPLLLHRAFDPFTYS